MQETTIYINLVSNAEVFQKEVYMKDIAKMTCRDAHILAKARTLKVYQFKNDKRQVIGILRLIEMLEEISPNLTVDNVGSKSEVVIEWLQEKHKTGICMVLKVIAISLICFCGTAFTIMSFHNDIGINQMFGQVYSMVTGVESDGCTILEIAYSLGLGSGIIIFFNHIGGRRLTKDPTPVEVEMRSYENEVNSTLVDTANREGKTIDAS